MNFFDVPRLAAMAPAAIRRAGRAARAAGVRDPRAARERRRLSIDGAPRSGEFFFQFFVFTPEPLPLRFRAAQVLAQLRILVTQALDLVTRGRRRIGVATRHASVMPDSLAEYKRQVRASVN
jgi:hypothetical protein